MSMKSAFKFRPHLVFLTLSIFTAWSLTVTAKPVIRSNIVIPSDIFIGGQTVLSRSLTDATSIAFDHGIGDITGTTSCIMKPNATTTYSLTATDVSDISTQTVTVSMDTLFVPTDDGAVVTLLETFTDSDKPDTIKLQTLNLVTPWGYNKTENSARRYPIVVNGCWGEGSLFREDIRKKYPSFYLDFNNYSTESDGETLATLIDELIRENYRIDTDRIYLTGFSRGGSGSFKIVRGMLSKRKLFAGIVRVAGQSESVLPDEAAEKTSLWYHIGLNDLIERIDVARATYENLKNKPANATAVESIMTDNITGYTRTTKTLTRNGIEIVKMSEYQGMDHEPGPCYNDPALFDWLFRQSLAN